MKRKTALLIATWALVGSLAGAQTLDDGLKKLMDQTGLKYSTTKSGNVKLTYTLDADRTQVVYLSTKSSKLGATEVREIWSNGGTVTAETESQTLITLLMDGGSKTLGAWLLEESDDGYLAYYSIKIPTNIAPAELKNALEFAAVVADEKEAELFEGDEY